MARTNPLYLSRRERQIMDIVYARGQASVNEVLDNLPDPPSYSAVRALMRILEDKGHLKHRKKGIKYVYEPTRKRKDAAKIVLRNIVDTYFGGSYSEAVSALQELGRGR